MKIKTLILAAFASFGVAQGAVTLQFSSTSVYVGGFQNSAGSINGPDARMVWGVIVDGDGDGLDVTGGLTTYASGFSLASNTAGLVLYWGIGESGQPATDDRLYIASAVMAQNSSAIDGAAIGDNRILAMSNLTFGGTANAGDRFYVVWFGTTTFSTIAGDAMPYGVLSDPSFVLPPDGSTTPYGASFAGADPSKPMTGVIGMPEPSTALLGALGLFGFLRRRR